MSESETEKNESLVSLLPQLLVDCDGQTYGYSNNITAAVFAVAAAINRLANAVEKRK